MLANEGDRINEKTSEGLAIFPERTNFIELGYRGTVSGRTILNLDSNKKKKEQETRMVGYWLVSR